MKYGGGECLRSYGVDPASLPGLGERTALDCVRKAIPVSHSQFIGSFADTLKLGDYLFVHAGVRPGIPLDEQSRTDLRWIREPFLGDRTDHGFVVVHGHTIREAVEELPNRIGIDTGAYRHGVLTAIGLEAGERWFIQAGTSVQN